MYCPLCDLLKYFVCIMRGKTNTKVSKQRDISKKHILPMKNRCYHQYIEVRFLFETVPIVALHSILTYLISPEGNLNVA